MPETLGAGVAPVEKPLEGLGRRQDAENFFLFRCRQPCPALAPFKSLLDPGALGRHLDVHVLDADLAAIGAAEDRDDLTQAGALAVEDVVEKNLAVEVALGKAVAAVVELGVRPALVQAERVEIGFEMAAHPIGADQLQRADRIRGRLAQRRRIGSGRRRTVAARPCWRSFPNRRAQFRECGRPVLADLGEEPAPALVDRAGVVEKARIEIGDKPGIGAGEKTRAVDICHR